jgi:hypothetical protein
MVLKTTLKMLLQKHGMIVGRYVIDITHRDIRVRGPRLLISAFMYRAQAIRSTRQRQVCLAAFMFDLCTRIECLLS